MERQRRRSSGKQQLLIRDGASVGRERIAAGSLASPRHYEAERQAKKQDKLLRKEEMQLGCREIMASFFFSSSSHQSDEEEEESKLESRSPRWQTFEDQDEEVKESKLMVSQSSSDSESEQKGPEGAKQRRKSLTVLS